MVFNRVAGDALDVIFAPDGSLSSARLNGVEVAGYLRGLNESNADHYLKTLGFQQEWKESEKEKAAFFQNLLPDGLVIESCSEITPTEFYVTAIAEKDRNIPCPVPKVKVLCKPNGSPLNIFHKT